MRLAFPQSSLIGFAPLQESPCFSYREEADLPLFLVSLDFDSLRDRLRGNKTQKCLSLPAQCRPAHKSKFPCSPESEPAARGLAVRGATPDGPAGRLGLPPFGEPEPLYGWSRLDVPHAWQCCGRRRTRLSEILCREFDQRLDESNE